MDDRVMLKVYYHGQILLQTSEGLKIVCENLLNIIIPFTLSFEELKCVICEKIDSQMSRTVSCILYRYPISVFGGFVQFQTKYMTNETSMQEMFSVYLESRSRILFIELYIEFERSVADRDIELEDYNSDSEEEFESNYEVVDPGVDKDQADDAMAADVADMVNALANQQLFEKPTFIRSLNLEAMHAPEEAVIKAMKDYTIRRCVDYRVHESEPMTFYAKCTQYGAGCDWLIRLDSITIVEVIKPLVEVDTSIKVNIQVNCFDRQNEVYEVRECPSGVEYAVDLCRQQCDCGEFQIDRLPCRHVFACYANQQLD
ncbi:hypothetical protein Ahy_A04g017769 [Arachis hypogaea]|uniref:SWIM-type domain-containing protein n=1 Tax=Arachis hypogaea TaxID=3818 RepID=A0A445DBZ3_ARAHY|nr:hypothetical protein Ahy_A04g017769 [Arachis hypogaea]